MTAETDDPWASVQFDVHGNLVDYSETQRVYWGKPPPAARPIHVLDVPPPVTGRRLILMYSDGPRYDAVAASEVWTDDAGSWIRVVEDWRWHTYQNTTKRTPHCPRTVAHPTLNVWVER